ncbi:N-6 DNA methylase [Aliarcobacter butzleri]|uniref:N-6 DNA methylase n=1 Tax=Aliarcobacter butzleri TaxID=28197 RepID=UPI00126A43DD|nr:N-6 DNA methylase [Aliarcobacter butzleri]
MDILTILKNSIINENEKTLKLPALQLERKVYEEIKKTLSNIGGKWKGGKVQAFVFDSNPKNLIDRLINGDKINLKKDFQFFATPKDVATKLIDLAKIEKHHTILEPSIGQGSLVEAINERFHYSNEIFGYELMEQNKEVLNNKNIVNLNILGDDFLLHDENIKFDRIIANPPFTKNQDIDHLQKMYKCLNDDGIVVCITSISWQIGNTKKQNDFKKWLSQVNAKIINLDANTFKESGTSIETRIIVIDKSITVKEDVNIEYQSPKAAIETFEEDCPSFDELFNSLKELSKDILLSLDDLHSSLGFKTETKPDTKKKELNISNNGNGYTQLSLF